ncbi:MAG: general secretion pathway protein GspB [Desulfococcaceae bacterium]
MSSILKALKKLENETAQEIGGDTWPHKIDARETLHKRNRRLILFSGPFLAGFAILGVGIAAALFYFSAPAERPVPPAVSVSPKPLADTPRQTPAPPPVIAQQNPPAPVPKRAPAPVNEVKAPEIPKAPETPFPPPSKPAAKAAPEPKAKSAPRFPTGQRPETRQPPPENAQTETTSAPRKMETPPTPFHRLERKTASSSQPSAMRLAVNEQNRLVRTKQPAPPSVPSERSPNAPPSALSKPVPTEPQYEVYKEKSVTVGPQPAMPTPENIEEPPAVRPAPDKAPDETAIIAAHTAIPEKSSDETGLQIQALVWSSDPASRMAVINGNIIKQGGNLGGAVLSFIGEDYILIRQEGQEWRVRFKLK